MPRTIQQAVANLEASIPVIQSRYEQGIEQADWQTAASSQAAERNYAAGVQAAVAAGSRAAGVRRVGNQAWRDRAMNIGAQRISEGVRSGLQRYQENFSPVLDAINNAVRQLPARSTDPVQNVTQRVVPVVRAAHAARRRGQGR